MTQHMIIKGIILLTSIAFNTYTLAVNTKNNQSVGNRTINNFTAGYRGTVTENGTEYNGNIIAESVVQTSTNINNERINAGAVVESTGAGAKTSINQQGNHFTINQKE